MIGPTIVVRAARVWGPSGWVETPASLRDEIARAGVRPILPVAPHFGPARIPRADRATQLAAVVSSAALDAIAEDPVAPAQLGLASASVLATALTNERFEARRRAGRPPEPRSFPYTAPNAAAGELAIAAAARGPTLALVGGPEVGLAALERACGWLRRGECSRVLVVAHECPPDAPERVLPPGVVAIECAAALVLERATGAVRTPAVEVDYVQPEREPRWTPWLSVEALAHVALAASARENLALTVAGPVGAALRVTVTAG